MNIFKVKLEVVLTGVYYSKEHMWMNLNQFCIILKKHLILLNRAGCWRSSTWRDRTSACASVLMEGMLLPSNVLLLVLILSRSFCTARGENHSIYWLVFFNISQNTLFEVKKKKIVQKERRNISKRPGGRGAEISLTEDIFHSVPF